MEMIMNNWIFNAYSEVYNTAMMHDVKPIAVANKRNEGRFGKLVKLLARG
jgi:hypothetical protein